MPLFWRQCRAFKQSVQPLFRLSTMMQPVSQVQGLWMESFDSHSLISAEDLDAMSSSLRVFYIGMMTNVKGKCHERYQELRFLHVESGVSNLPISISNLKHLRYLSIGYFKENVILSPSMNLPNLNVLKFRWSKIHGIAEISHFCSLKQLDLTGCNTDGISQCLLGLHNLRRLILSNCEDLTELPESLVKLRSLEELDLSNCSHLKQLSTGFGELVSLTVLDLSYCWSLQELPWDLEKLPSLQTLKIDRCKSLTYLPHCLGEMSVWGSSINFKSCSSLKMLPSRFGELTHLQELVLLGCESLQELCNNFHCLVELKTLYLSCCKRLSSLPLGFGKLSSLETLDLSGSDKLEESCSDFHCLVALNYLNLSKCDNLCQLPVRFGELSCLKRLDLSGCSNLVMLSDDFHLLQSLIRLNLSKFKNLGGEWMDSVGSIRRLWRLDIVCSERMIQQWTETKSQKERNPVVVTDYPQGREGERALLLQGVLSKIFDEEGLLLDAHQYPFHSSSLQPQTPVILIIDSKYEAEWGTLRKNLQQLQHNSRELRIIYVGRHFKSLTSELLTRILAYTAVGSRTSFFYHKLSATFDTRSTAVFHCSDQLEQNDLKCLSAWEDISFILD